MPTWTREAIFEDAQEKNVHFIRLAFSYVNRILKNVEIPVSQLDKALDNEMAFDGSSIDGFVRIEEADMKLYPDLNTWTVFPWGSDDRKVAILICDIRSEEHTSELQSRFDLVCRLLLEKKNKTSVFFD